MLTPGIAVITPYILFKEESILFRYVNFICLFFVLMSILRHYFKEPKRKKSTIDANLELEKAAYKKSGLTDNKSNEYVDQLVLLMEKNKLFLKPDLTLDELSKKMNVPKHHLTEALNVNLNKTFYQFINEYRVNEFKKRITDSSKKENLVYLAYDCGFNSKTTFFNYFKKLEGMTPSAYRKQTVL